MYQKIFKHKLIIIGLVLIGSLLAFTNPSDRYFEIAKNLDVFASLYKEVNIMYVDEVNPNTIMNTGIEAMLATLDPYTNYIPEDAIEDYRTQSTGQYGGIGAVTTRIDGKIKVSMILDGYSAQKNGLKIGDEVIKIDNIDIRDKTAEVTSDLMKGQANTPVSLTVLRFGNESPLTLNFKREKVTISNVPYTGMVSEDIGYIQLTQFTQHAGKEVETAVKELKNKGAKKVILDLRGNPGGLLLEAVNITNVFISKGKDVVSTIGKIETNNATYKTLNQPVDIDMPIAVLINSGSASASEIVAATIQDYDRGIIIGQKSFGKGLVQITRPLSYNAQLKVTTAKYYTPSGRCIQALDYSHRNPDGSVGKVPDSLKQEFKTANNRSVYNGGGVDPDIIVEPAKLSPIEYTLYSKGHIFDYATKYFYENPKIDNAKSFKLTENEYEAFKVWLKSKDYNYTTDVESHLEQLVDNAKKEKYYNDINSELDKLKTTLQKSKNSDLSDFEEQIKALLEVEIASRYYFENGTVEAGFNEDKSIIEAITVLNDQVKYSDILQ